MDHVAMIAAVEAASLAPASRRFDTLANSLKVLTREQVGECLTDCGIIPEVIHHDSTPEKLWAKCCDILMSRALSELGIACDVIRTRGNSADVRGKAADFTLVGDAKAFRLSRTAKNQKDFKIKALDDWRQSDTFACLLAPLYQYPTTESQIYAQAKERNVTLLSYVHLKFLLDYPPAGGTRPLWVVPGSLQPDAGAVVYWRAIDAKLVEITGQKSDALRSYKVQEIEKTRQIGAEGVRYWESVKQRYGLLTREEAIAKLVKAEKVDAKIRVIQKAIARDVIL